MTLAPRRFACLASSTVLRYLGARLWRNAVSTVIGGWVARGDWSLHDAQRVIQLSASGNARRAYGLEPIA